MTSRSSITTFTILAIAALLTLPALAETPVATATFKCQGGKSIEATFYASSVSLTLSDGRSLTVPQAMSGSGARYANKDETFVFWNKGDTAFVTKARTARRPIPAAPPSDPRQNGVAKGPGIGLVSGQLRGWGCAGTPWSLSFYVRPKLVFLGPSALRARRISRRQLHSLRPHRSLSPRRRPLQNHSPKCLPQRRQ